MDRIEFSNSIDNVDTGYIIEQFDSIMALYNIVGSYDNIKVSKTSAEVASFDVILKDEDHAMEVIATCDSMTVSIYEQNLTILCELCKPNTVHIRFVK